MLSGWCQREVGTTNGSGLNVFSVQTKIRVEQSGTNDIVIFRKILLSGWCQREVGMTNGSRLNVFSIQTKIRVEKSGTNEEQTI